MRAMSGYKSPLPNRVVRWFFERVRRGLGHGAKRRLRSLRKLPQTASNRISIQNTD